MTRCCLSISWNDHHESQNKKSPKFNWIRLSSVHYKEKIWILLTVSRILGFAWISLFFDLTNYSIKSNMTNYIDVKMKIMLKLKMLLPEMYILWLQIRLFERCKWSTFCWFLSFCPSVNLNKSSVIVANNKPLKGNLKA